MFNHDSLLAPQHLCGQESLEDSGLASRDGKCVIQLQSGALVIQAVCVTVLEDPHNSLVTGSRGLEGQVRVTIKMVTIGNVKGVGAYEDQRLGLLQVRYHKGQSVYVDRGTEEVRWECYIQFNVPQVWYSLSVGPFYFKQVIQWLDLVVRKVCVVERVRHSGDLGAGIEETVELIPFDLNLTGALCSY